MKVGEIGHMGKNYPATLENLYEMLQYIRDEAFSVGFNQTHISKIELAAEEALVNIINHGYSSESGSISINCMPLDENGLEIVIEDEGLPFDPLGALKDFSPATASDEEVLDNDQIGGYGIYFIVNMMDQVTYQRVNNSNRLTLKKFT